MQIEITKYERQQEGAFRWRNNKGIGCLNWVPRFGKTFGAIHFIINKHLLALETNKVIIVVPSEVIAKQWQVNLKAYCDTTDKVEVYTTNYIQLNDLNLECTLLVVDEIHRFTTPAMIAIVDIRIKHIYRLGLTGTYPYEDKFLTRLFPIVDTITEDEAIAHKWISNFVEYNILLELPDKDKIKYAAFSTPIQETLSLFKDKYKLFNRGDGTSIFASDFELLEGCYRGVKTTNFRNESIWLTYDALCNTLAYMLGWNIYLDISIEKNKDLHENWSPNAIHTRAKNFIDFTRRRNDLLINNPVKLKAIGEIIEANKVPTICFNESTAFADNVSEYINAKFTPAYKAVCYHSKVGSRYMINPDTNDYYVLKTGPNKGEPKVFGATSIKNMVLDGFKSGFYHFISTAKALDEGLDVPNIEQVICSAGTTNPLTYQQRTARGKTVDIYNLNKITRIFNLVFDDFINPEDGVSIKSRDKQKLLLRQRSNGNAIKNWVYSVSEINFSD